MGALLAKLADIAWQIFKGGRELRARVNRTARTSLVHLEGVRNAPPGDSQTYRDEKHLLGEELKKLTEAAGEAPGKFGEELRVARLVQQAVVIGGERYVDRYIAELERIAPTGR
jgi:hypothetical protein